MSSVSVPQHPFRPLGIGVGTLTRAIVVLAVMFSALVAVPAVVAAQTYPESYDTPTPDYAGAQVMVDLINEHRAANGVAPVIFDVAFSDRTETFAVALAAQFPPPPPEPGWDYACPKVNYDTGFRHDKSSSIWDSVPPGTINWGENMVHRCGGAGFDEKIYWAFDSFLGSPWHNSIMVDPIFTHVAVSVVHYGRSTFAVQRFAEVPGTSPAAALGPPRVRATESCLAGRGRMDTYVTNTNPSTVSYSVRVTGANGFATTRNVDIRANQTRRVTITGRYDGVHRVEVRPKVDPGAVPVKTSVTIDCANGEISRPVIITNSCLLGNGRIDVYLGNKTTSRHTYVVDIQSGAVEDRSITLGAGEKGVVTATGRPEGKVPISVRMDGALIHRTQVTVDCDR